MNEKFNFKILTSYINFIAVSNEEIKQDLSSFRFEVLNTIKHHQNKTMERLEEFEKVNEKQRELEASIDSVHDTLGAILTELQNIKTLQNENMYRIAEMTSSSKDIAVKTKRQLEEKPFAKLIDNLNRDTDSDDDATIFSFKDSSRTTAKDKKNIKGTFV